MELFVQANSKIYIQKLVDLGIRKIIVGMEQFSCRQAISLTYLEVEEITQLSTEIYVLVNALIEEKYLKELEIHLEKLHHIGIAGVIFQDFSVLQICKEKGYSFSCIYHPDTLNTNHQTLSYLQTRGVGGAFLAREIPLIEKIHIQDRVQMPCIMQIHGVEYMAYSKRKLIQDYLEATDKVLEMNQKEITIQATNVEDACYIYEDTYGTHILTKTQLLSLDVLDKMIDVQYGYVESLYLSPEELLQVVRLYVQGLQALQENVYQDIKKGLVEQLTAIQTQVKYYHSFLFDQTVYKIADVRKREEDERS